MVMDIFLVFCGVVLLAGLNDAESMGSVCGGECVQYHGQEHYCQADFVIRGKVASREYLNREGMPDMGAGMETDMPFNHYLVYKVTVEKAYKGPLNMEEGTDVYIRTEADNNMCGISSLMNGKSYLITGQKEEGVVLNISGCNWVQKFKNLTAAQKTGVKKYYSANCNKCVIETCGPGRCRASNNTTCTYNPNAAGNCHSLHSYCNAKKSGVCKWERKREEMKECLAAN